MAECSGDATCVAKSDLKTFLQIAEERQCLEKTKPTFEFDQVIVLTDKDGRVFYTGADPKRPYKLTMHWCHYEVDVEGEIHLVAALRTPETWGFRFRPKAYLGYLPLKLTEASASFDDGIDAGIMVDLFFVEWTNVNAAVGFRSVGLGAGFDLTENFGLYAGYHLGWTAPLHNVSTSLYFAF